jgi:hypothetical protein
VNPGTLISQWDCAHGGGTGLASLFFFIALFHCEICNTMAKRPKSTSTSTLLLKLSQFKYGRGRSSNIAHSERLQIASKIRLFAKDFTESEATEALESGKSAGTQVKVNFSGTPAGHHLSPKCLGLGTLRPAGVQRGVLDFSVSLGFKCASDMNGP